MPGARIPYVTSEPIIVSLLLQMLGLRPPSEEGTLLPCLIGLNIAVNDSNTDGIDLELRYGCTITVEKAHFVSSVLHTSYHEIIRNNMKSYKIIMSISCQSSLLTPTTTIICRMKSLIVWVLFLSVINDVWLKTTKLPCTNLLPELYVIFFESLLLSISHI